MSFSAPAVHIAGLTTKWEEGNKDLAELRERFDSADTKYKADLEAALAGLREVSNDAERLNIGGKRDRREFNE